MSDDKQYDLREGLGGRAYDPHGIAPAGYRKLDPHIEVERKRIQVRRLELQVEEAKLDLQQAMVNFGMLSPVRETVDKDNVAIAALSLPPIESPEEFFDKHGHLDVRSTQGDSQSASGSSDSDASLAPSELSLALAGGVEPNPHILPPGFMAWSSDPLHPTNPRPADNDTVICWMGGEDFVGPIPAKDFDWHHASDPILGYQIVNPAPQAPADDKLAEFLKLEGAKEWDRRNNKWGPTGPGQQDVLVEIIRRNGETEVAKAGVVYWIAFGAREILAYRILPSTETSGEVEKNDALLDQEQRVPDESNSQASSTDEALELVEQPERILSFGEGAYMVDTGLSNGKPAVFVEPVEEAGEPNTFVPRDIAGPLDKLRPGAVAITFPTMEQAEAAANLFCGGEPPTDGERIGLDSQPAEQDRVDLEKPLSVLNADAAVFAEGIVRESQKKEEPRKFGIFGDIAKFGRS